MYYPVPWPGGSWPQRYHYRSHETWLLGRPEQAPVHDQGGRYVPHEGTFQGSAPDFERHEVCAGCESDGGEEQDAGDDCMSTPFCPRCRRTATDHVQGSYSPNTTDKKEYEKKCTLTTS